jgi:methyl-accepting chemotaxis protein
MKSIGVKLTAILLGVILLGIAITFGVATAISGSAITNESLAKIHKTTQFESERLDRWLSAQTKGIDTLAGIISNMDNLADILTADQTYASMSMEDQTLGILRPFLKAVLDDNKAYFETYMGLADGTAVAGSGYQFDYSWWTSYQRGWYKLALTDTTRAHITSPYIDAQTGELCISAVRAVTYRGELIGVLGSDIFVTELQNITLDATLDSNGYSMLIDKNGDILIHPDKEYAPDKDGEFLSLAAVSKGVYADLWKQIPAMNKAQKFPDAKGTVHYFNSIPLASTGWYMVAALPEKVVTQPITNVILTVIPIAVVILLLAAFFIFLTVQNTVTKPLMPLTAFMVKVGETGDFTLSREAGAALDEYSEHRNEIGQCIKEVTKFIRHMIDLGEILEKIADGDLTTEFTLLSESDNMGKSLQKMVNSLSGMFGMIRASTNQVSSGARQIADTAASIENSSGQMAGSAKVLADGSTRQASSVEKLSNSIGEIAEKTKANADVTDQAAKLADTIINKAENGSRQMDDMVTAVNDITEASKAVSNIMETINGIAAQTNLLSLNAAIEAARAGEHGKGFAVVAEEVRKLATQSEEAANETSSIIQNSIQKAELGVRVAGEMAASLTEIVTGINESSRLIMEIARVSEEQSTSISEINVNIDQVAEIIEQNSVLAKESAAAGEENAAASEESAAAAEEMSSQSDILENLISQFKLKQVM